MTFTFRWKFRQESPISTTHGSTKQYATASSTTRCSTALAFLWRSDPLCCKRPELMHLDGVRGHEQSKGGINERYISACGRDLLECPDQLPGNDVWRMRLSADRGDCGPERVL